MISKEERQFAKVLLMQYPLDHIEHVVAKALIREFPDDGEELVTREWLESLGAVLKRDGSRNGKYDAYPVCLPVRENLRLEFYINGIVVLASNTTFSMVEVMSWNDIKTRSQVRALCYGLGVKMKGEV